MEPLRNKEFNMKKTVTAREFMRGFAKLQKALQPGETINITNRGKPLGRFVKEPANGVPLPNFLEHARADGYGPAVGDVLFRKLLADEAVS
jgi:antitoxin (DNA-binding transcriptional repressor) of toxin-antitoxin stability system